ncbi:hypothetical protein B484DRAFT_329396 [Ochromonadaceae sp. CCMP2298]|nr:hypothetical protein B484DRAFT_329396 [Ochromonadaceae sp. CCMP2298]
MSASLQTRNVLVATGSRANRPEALRNGVPLRFARGQVVDSTEMGGVGELPNAVAILGGGVIAVEYATVLAELRVGVTLICAEGEFMPFLEPTMRAALKARMLRDRVLIVHEQVESIQMEQAPALAVSTQKLQRRFKVDMLLYSGGRDANSEGLGCAECGIDVGRYGRIDVHPLTRRTSCSAPRTAVFAVGDVTGPPGLASSAQQQGRSVAHALFDDLRQPMLSRLEREVLEEQEGERGQGDWVGRGEQEVEKAGREVEERTEGTLFGSLVGGQSLDAPMTIWTIPEMSSVGEQLCPLFVCRVRCGVGGVALFKDMARGRLSGDLDGFLKIVAVQVAGVARGRPRHRILGVHIFGDGANELIQLGSILVHSGATLEQVTNTPFAAVTLSGLFQMASDDALSQTSTWVEY